MAGRGRLIGALALVVLGVFGVCVTCGLPMWRETSFVGANIVTAQSVWDGLWLHCVVQSTGQMQCKKHTTATTLTSDIQAGRALTLISILAGVLGFIITLLGGGAVDCNGSRSVPDPFERQNRVSSRKKACLLGGILCILAGVLCLISVSWSAAMTVMVYNDPLIIAALKREVGSAVYIGFGASVLLLLGGAVMCCVCGEKERPQPSVYTYMPYSPSSQYTYNDSSRMATVMSDNMRPASMRIMDRPVPRRMMEHEAQVHNYNSPKMGMYDQPLGTIQGSEQDTLVRYPSTRSGTLFNGKIQYTGM